MKVTVGIVSRCEQELTVAIFNRYKQTWLYLISLENATSLFNRSRWGFYRRPDVPNSTPLLLTYQPFMFCRLLVM